MERGDAGQLLSKWQERFAVNTEARESDVVKIHSDEKDAEGRGKDVGGLLREALGDQPYVFQKAGGELEGRALGADEGGGGLWLWLAAIAAAFFLMESAWSMVISKPEQ
jgi:hypothetical protein